MSMYECPKCGGVPGVTVCCSDAQPEQIYEAPPDETLLTNLIRLLPGCYYMDPPDGGSVTILEQFERMAKDAARYRWLRDTGSPLWPTFQKQWHRPADQCDAAIDAAMAQGEKP